MTPPPRRPAPPAPGHEDTVPLTPIVPHDPRDPAKRMIVHVTEETSPDDATAPLAPIVVEPSR